MKLHSLGHFALWNVLTFRLSAVRTPRQLLHNEYIDNLMEVWSGGYRILHLHALGTINILHRVHKIIEVALLGVQLVNKEDDRLLQFLRITEYILGSYFRSILSVDKDYCLICYV